MAQIAALDMGRLKQTIRDICKIFEINGETLFTVMLGCAARGKADWTRESVIHIIRMIKNGKDAHQIIDDIMANKTRSHLN